MMLGDLKKHIWANPWLHIGHSTYMHSFPQSRCHCVFIFLQPWNGFCQLQHDQWPQKSYLSHSLYLNSLFDLKTQFHPRWTTRAKTTFHTSIALNWVLSAPTWSMTQINMFDPLPTFKYVICLICKIQPKVGPKRKSTKFWYWSFIELVFPHIPYNEI